MVKEQSWTRMDIGFHRFTLENYSLSRGIGQCIPIRSTSFTVGGHEWVASAFPGGILLHEDDEHIYLAARFEIIPASSEKVRCMYKVTLIDQSGMGNHLTRSMFDEIPSAKPISVPAGHNVGYGKFIRRDILEKSCYLKDNCLKFEYTLEVVLPSEIETKIPSIVVSKFDDVGVDFLALLETEEGFDIIFHVGPEKFHAHRLILSARSMVFESMFGTDSVQELVITGIEPRVFKALLHFIYTDSLPDDERCLMDGYAFGTSFGAKLLAAADQYDMGRLKAICESHLWRSITLNTFAEILMLADKCNATKLRHLCFNYATDNYDVLTELGSFTYLRTECPSLLTEMTDYASKKKQLNVKLVKKQLQVKVLDTFVH